MRIMLGFPKAVVAHAIVVFVCVSGISADKAAVQVSICIAPVRDEASTLDNETGDQRGYVSYEFNVRIDRGNWVKVPSDKPLRIKDIELGKNHLVSIRDGNHLIESFWFTFEGRGGTNLCLSYKPWYQTWLLEPPRNRPWCRCKD